MAHFQIFSWYPRSHSFWTQLNLHAGLISSLMRLLLLLKFDVIWNSIYSILSAPSWHYAHIFLSTVILTFFSVWYDESLSVSNKIYTLAMIPSVVGWKYIRITLLFSSLIRFLDFFSLRYTKSTSCGIWYRTLGKIEEFLKSD